MREWNLQRHREAQRCAAFNSPDPETGRNLNRGLTHKKMQSRRDIPSASCGHWGPNQRQHRSAHLGSALICGWKNLSCLAFVQTVERGEGIAVAIQALPAGQRDRTDQWSDVVVASLGCDAAAVQLASDRCWRTTHKVVRSGTDRTGRCLLELPLFNARTPRTTGL